MIDSKRGQIIDKCPIDLVQRPNLIIKLSICGPQSMFRSKSKPSLGKFDSFFVVLSLKKVVVAKMHQKPEPHKQ